MTTDNQQEKASQPNRRGFLRGVVAATSAAFGSCWHWNAFVAELEKRQASQRARAAGCFGIDPIHTDPGLVAYECPSCSYVTSVLTPSTVGSRKPRGPDSTR